MFSFKISPANVLPDNAECGEVDSGAKENGGDYPAGCAFEHAENREHQKDKHREHRKSCDEHAGKKYHINGLYSEGTESVQ